MILILRKDKYILGRNYLYFLGSGEKLVFFKGFGEQRQNTFREPRQLFSGIWGDQCIIFRDQGSTDPPGGPRKYHQIDVYIYQCATGIHSTFTALSADLVKALAQLML